MTIAPLAIALTRWMLAQRPVGLQLQGRHLHAYLRANKVEAPQWLQDGIPDTKQEPSALDMVEMIWRAQCDDATSGR